MHRHPQTRPAAPFALLPLLSALLLALLVLLPPMAPVPPARAQADDQGDDDPFTMNPILVEQAERESNLAKFVNDAPSAPVIPARLHTRRALLAERAQYRAAADADGVASLNSVLASEAFERVASVTTRWLDRRDPATGLFPHTLKAEDRYWSYGDAGSDLFPFLGIATRYLMPERYGEILATLAAERSLTRGFPARRLPGHPPARRAGAGEGRCSTSSSTPRTACCRWSRRSARTRGCRGCARSWTPSSNASDTPTPVGPIPSPAAEVNGSALQALARLTWATDDPRYLQMGRQIASAYLDHTLPTTEYIPPHRWDFMENEPIGPRRFYLGDHGNEIVAGLVEWHRVETRLGLPEAAAHREAINRMLDRLLQKGRTPEGLWYEIIDVPSGKVRDHDLTDNWGYLGQAYLDQAAIRARRSVRRSGHRRPLRAGRRPRCSAPSPPSTSTSGRAATWTATPTPSRARSTCCATSTIRRPPTGSTSRSPCSTASSTTTARSRTRTSTATSCGRCCCTGSR